MIDGWHRKLTQLWGSLYNIELTSTVGIRVQRVVATPGLWRWWQYEVTG